MLDIPIISGSEPYFALMAAVALYRVVRFLINLF